MRQPNSHRRRGSRVNIANRASTPAQTNLRSRRSVVIQTFTFTDSLRVIASKREQTSGLFSTPNRMWMQLNSTNGGSAHDMVSLARQTERSLNPAGFTSGAHLVKGQQKVSARRGHIKKPTATSSVAVVFPHSNLNALPFTRAVTVGQTSAAPRALKQDLSEAGLERRRCDAAR